MKKKSRINKNSIPFIILTIIHLVFLALIMKKKNHKNTWVLLLSNIGFAYLFEYIVLNLLQAYTYKPRIIKKRYLDNIFGAILSQAVFVPIISTFLTVFQKNWKWKLSFALYYYVIEKLFLKLGIYKINWWKTYYTFILITLYFYISDGFYQALIRRKNWALKIAHYFSIEVISITTLYISAVKRKIRFGTGFIHLWREHFIIAPFYSLFLSLIAVYSSSKTGLFYRLIQPIINMIIDLYLNWKKILKFNFSAYFNLNFPFYILMFFLSRILYQTVYKPQ